MLAMLVTLIGLAKALENLGEGVIKIGFKLINMTKMLKKSSSPPDMSVPCNRLHSVLREGRMYHHA